MMKRLLLLTLLLSIALPISQLRAAERMAIKSDVANIRSGPGVKNELLWQIEKYHPILVVGREGDWLHFKDFEGDSGWVHKSLVDKTPTVIIRVRRCNVRQGPGTDYEVAFSVDKGVPFKVLQRKGRWIQVQHADGDIGWVFDRLVW